MCVPSPCHLILGPVVEFLTIFVLSIGSHLRCLGLTPGSVLRGHTRWCLWEPSGKRRIEPGSDACKADVLPTAPSIALTWTQLTAQCFPVTDDLQLVDPFPNPRA